MDRPNRLPPAVELAHQVIAPFLREGDWTLDATAGNGWDTLFLCRKTSPSGRVFAIDIQPAAMESTRQRLQAAEPAFCGNATLLTGCHSRIPHLLPAEAKGRLQAILFNLGYLPGGDKTVITRTATTLAALEHALAWLAPGGLLSLTLYPGHEGGDQEARGIEQWASDLSPEAWQVGRWHLPLQPSSPRWIGVFKKVPASSTLPAS